MRTVSLAHPLQTGFLLTVGVFLACVLLLGGGLLFSADLADDEVRSACVEHGGVERITKSPTFRLKHTASIVCRDGWFATR